MTTFGLTDTGFVTPTISDIREALNTNLRNAFGASIDLGEKSAFGQIVGIFSERIASVWEVAEAVNSSQNVDKATAAALDALCALTGTFRPPASYSGVTLTLTGTPLTDVAAGSIAKTASTLKKFITTADVTITSLSAWTALSAYALADRVTNASRAYECTTAGTAAGSGGPTSTSTAITDGTVTWAYLGEGTGAIDAPSRAEFTGVTEAFARDISVIETSVGGWSTVVNLLDATLGRDVAQDGELRLLRESELASSGSSTIDALRAELLNVSGALSATVFVNNTDSVNADGMPPHSVEALIRPTDPVPDSFDQDVYDVLLAGVAAGIVTQGTTVGAASDSEGTSHVMKYSRPDEIEIYVHISITVDSTIYPTDGDAQVKAAIALWGDLQKSGKNAVISGINAQAFGVVGVLDVTACAIDVTPTPVATANIPISLRQLATYDTSRIVVTSTPGTP